MIIRLIKIAREAGRFAKGSAGNIRQESIQMKSSKDMVTDIDLQVQQLIHTRVKEYFPQVDFWAEEFDEGEHVSAAELIIVDPIDGTNNFIHGHPFYNISIAYRKNGVTMAGVVYAPDMDDLYYAVLGAGAYKNKTRLQVSEKNKLEECIGLTGFAALRSGSKPNNLSLFTSLAPKLQSVRINGASALDLCFIAEGRFDLMWFYNLNPWDTAAGELILREAGGKVSDFQGENGHELKKQIIATNGVVHDSVVACIQAALHRLAEK